MTPVEWGLLVGILAQSVAIITALVKLVAWVTQRIAVVIGLVGVGNGWAIIQVVLDAVPIAIGTGSRAARIEPMLGMKFSRKASSPNSIALGTPIMRRAIAVSTPVASEAMIMVSR